MRSCGTQRVLRRGRVTACSFGRSRARASDGKAASSLLRMADFDGVWANMAPRAGRAGAQTSLRHPLPGAVAGDCLIVVINWAEGNLPAARKLPPMIFPT